MIKPGQQAILNYANIKVEENVDIDQVMSWKNGKFVFRNTNIQLIMRQMERWYDFSSSQYDNDVVKAWEFNGEITRYTNASKVLEFLEENRFSEIQN